MLSKIESLREDINKIIETEVYDKNKLLKKSQELDTYIIKFMKEKSGNNEEVI